MRDFQTKQNTGGIEDSIIPEKWGSGEFNAMATELEVAVSSTDQVLAPANGTDEKLDQLARAMAIYGAANPFMNLTQPAANTIELRPSATNRRVPDNYDQMNGYTVQFIVATDITGALTINFGPSTGALLGDKPFRKPDNSEFVSGDLLADDFVEAYFLIAADQWRMTPSAFQSSSGGQSVVPVGSYLEHSGDTAPAGYLIADGSEVSRTTFAALFNLYDTLGLSIYGPGDGSTTFNLPDRRGVFGRGLDLSAGIDPGRTIGSTQIDQMQGHRHRGFGLAAGGGGPNAFTNISSNNLEHTDDTAIRQAINDGVNGEPRIGLETRPTNMSVLVCVKF